MEYEHGGVGGADFTLSRQSGGNQLASVLTVHSLGQVLAEGMALGQSYPVVSITTIQVELLSFVPSSSLETSGSLLGTDSLHL